MKHTKKAETKTKPKAKAKAAPHSKELSEDQLDQVAGGAIFMQSPEALTISGNQPVGGNAPPTESFSLKYAKIEFEYKEQK